MVDTRCGKSQLNMILEIIVDFSKGVISRFQQNYVKTGLFDKEYSSNAKKIVAQVKRYVEKLVN